MPNTLDVHPGCDCILHQKVYENWPKENAEIRISSCMRTCPYCGKRHSNSSRLRKHLRQRKYQERNILIAAERPGAVGIGSPHYVSNGSKNNDEISPTKTFQAVSREDLGSILREIQAEFGPEFEVLTKCHLSSWNSMSEQNKDLWIKSTSSIPYLLHGSHCWHGRAPLARELFMDTIRGISTENPKTRKTSETRFRVNFQGEMDEASDPYMVLSQLIDPDPNNFGFRVPYDISTVVERFEETNNQVNLTPKYSFVDLHIDYGADGLSTVVGDCRKVWLLYPPTDNNLKAMKSVDGQRAKLLRLVHQLEGGILIETASSNAIFIPAGCAHATFTLQGGYLVTKDFTTAKSLNAIASFIVYGLDETLPTDAREICFDWFERCLDVTLTQRQVITAVSAWLKAEAKLAIWASSHRRWRVGVRRLWEHHCHDLAASCPCGLQDASSSFFYHFSSVHMGSFLTLSQLRHRR